MNNSGSGIINIPSKKKRKIGTTGKAAELSEKYHGQGTGIVDPNNLSTTKKAGNKSRKRKK